MKHILVVDDAVTVRLYIKNLLLSFGDYVAVEAENGMHALEIMQSLAADLLIVDVNMPKMDGYTFLHEVRRQECFWGIPAIVATTEGRYEDRMRALAAGANLHLAKPFYPVQFQNAVSLLTGTAP